MELIVGGNRRRVAIFPHPNGADRHHPATGHDRPGQRREVVLLADRREHGGEVIHP